MLNFNATLTDQASILRNQRALQASLYESLYVRYFNPASLRTAGVATLSGTEATEYINFPDNDNSPRAWASLPIPAHWRQGNARFTMFWGGSVGSTNNVNWTLHRRVTAVGGDYTTNDTATIVVIPGPATANTWQRYTWAANVPIAGNHRLLTFRLLRAGADVTDTYAGAAHLLMCLWRFVPSVQECGVPLPEEWWEV